MAAEPAWPPVELLIELNRREVDRAGHAFGLRDFGLLESASRRPYNLWAYEDVQDVLELAGALMFGLARNHPFLDGNKRTAFAAADVFLQANGYELPSMLDGVDLAERFIAAIERKVSEAAFLTYLRANLDILD